MVDALVISMVLFSGSTLPPYATAYRFDDFRVSPEAIASPARPKPESRRARLFRTQLRRAAAEGPNFAGHLRVAEWGCGTCCVDFAIIDLETGDVWMPGFYMSCGYPQTDDVRGQAGLYFREDSALFVAIGSKSEGPRAAVYYYRWNGRGLELLRTDLERQNE
jgi:hypothetical protein